MTFTILESDNTIKAEQRTAEKVRERINLGVGYTIKAEQRELPRKSEREPGDPLVGVNQEDRCQWRGHLTQVSVKAFRRLAIINCNSFPSNLHCHLSTRPPNKFG